MAKDSPCHPINLTILIGEQWLQKTSRILLSEPTVDCQTQFDLDQPLWLPSESGQISVDNLFGLLFICGKGDSNGRLSVSLGLTWATGCSCLPRRDRFAGCWAVLLIQGESLY